MYYKKQKIKGKWYPRSITASKYETKDVAERLAAMSTVSLGDAYAVLVGLGEVLGDMMQMGNSVKLDGLGTFYLVGKANGEGVDTPEEVTANQFGKVKVAFIPEYRREGNHKVARRTIVPNHVESNGIPMMYGRHSIDIMMSPSQIRFPRKRVAPKECHPLICLVLSCPSPGT